MANDWPWPEELDALIAAPDHHLPGQSCHGVYRTRKCNAGGNLHSPSITEYSGLDRKFLNDWSRREPIDDFRSLSRGTLSRQDFCSRLEHRVQDLDFMLQQAELSLGLKGKNWLVASHFIDVGG